MKKAIFLLLAIVFFTSCQDDMKFESIQSDDTVLTTKELNQNANYTATLVLHDEVYHQSTDADRDVNTKCDFDYYRPTERKGEVLPVVVVLHEGAFLSGNNSDFVAEKMSKDFARSGYAVANMNYRLINNLRVLVSKEATRRYIMEAVAHVRLGIQHLRQNADNLLIDTSRIYVIGWSSGAIIANSLVYTDRDEAFSYVAPKHRNNFNNNEIFDAPLHLAGIVSIGGALLMQNHVDDEDVANTKILMIHGTVDDMVPIGEGTPCERYQKGNDIELPTFSPTLKIGNQTYSIGSEINIPDWMSERIVKTVLSPVYGSRAIFNLTESPNVKMIEIEGGNHAFFLTNGAFNANYNAIKTRIENFIQ
jgi:predicted esterase